MEHHVNLMKTKDIFNLSKDAALHHFYERVISVPISVRTALKKELRATIGDDRTKGVFIRYGWHCGMSDAEKSKALGSKTELDLIKMGPKFHILHGYLDDVDITNLEMDEHGHTKRIDLIWTNSFEAAEYLREHDINDTPVCHHLCGYASGYLSSVLNTQVIVKETACVGMGHTHCEAVCMPLAQWGDELENEHRYYQQTSMLEELDEVTAKLKKEKDYLTQANDVLKQFTNALLSNQGIQKIVDLLYETTGVTACIENEQHEPIVFAGTMPANYACPTRVEEPTLLTCADVHVLKAPIFFEHAIKGYCSFIYDEPNTSTNLHYLLLDKASLTASIVLLNEQVKIHTEQNVRRNFLNDVLATRLTADEIHKIAYYLKFKPDANYSMLVMKHEMGAQDDTFELTEAVVQHIHQFFQTRHVNAIISPQDQQLTILLDDDSVQQLNLKRHTFFEYLLKHCARRFKTHTFAIGVSSVLPTIQSANTLYEEAQAAIRMYQANKSIYYFEDLELESLLFQLERTDVVDRFIDKQVGLLLAEDKDFDLTNTLYRYIEQGMNLNHTAKVLTMSISGLRYRLAKISELLHVSLDDTERLFSIFMALKILKAQGHIKLSR